MAGPTRASSPVVGPSCRSDTLLGSRVVTVAKATECRRMAAGICRFGGTGDRRPAAPLVRPARRPGQARPYRLVMPPSTRNTAPVAYADSSLARYTTIPVTSSGVPGRPSGVRDTIAARAAGSPEIVDTSDVSV
jgi:hypothetical protein